MADRTLDIQGNSREDVVNNNSTGSETRGNKDQKREGVNAGLGQNRAEGFPSDRQDHAGISEASELGFEFG